MTASKPDKLADIESIRGHELDPTTARARLAELLGDPDEDVRAEASAAVWEHADEASLVERAVATSTGDSSPRVRAKAITALGRVLYEGDTAGAGEPGYKPDPLLGDPSPELFGRVRGHLLGIARDESKPLDERRFALEGLGFLGDDEEVHALVERFWKMSEGAARLSAVFAMGRSGHPRWAKAIEEALGSADAELKLQAIWAAGEAEVVPARERLLAMTRSGTRDERLAAIESVARLGGESVGSALLELAEGDGDPEIREAAATGLEELALLDALDAGGEGDADA